MRGSLLKRLGDGMFTMLYYGEDLIGFFSTNQDAWLYLMADRNEYVEKSRPTVLWPPMAAIVSIVVLPENHHDKIGIAELQTFRLSYLHDINYATYTGVIHELEVREKYEELAKKDWKESVVK